MKLIFVWTFLLISTSSFCQEVSTFVPSGSGVDEALFRSKDGILYGGSWDNGALYSFSNLGSVQLGDSFIHITEITAFSDGVLVFCDNFGSAIYLYDPITEDFSLLNEDIHQPAGVKKMPGVDTILVATASRKSLYKMDRNGNITPFLNGGLLDSPVTMEYDTLGNLYIGNYYSGKIIRVSPDKDVRELCQLSTNSLGHMRRVDNDLYVTGVGSHEIYKVNLEDGSWISWAGSRAGSQNGNLSSATFNAPNGIEASVTGDTLYISDFNTEEIRMITGVKSTSSIKEEAFESSIDIVPNPTAGLIKVQGLDDYQQLSFVLVDLYGEEVFSGDIRNDQLLLLPEFISTGIYIAHFFDQKGPLGSQKIILKR